MALQFVNVRGEVLTEHRMQETAKRQRRPKSVAEKEPQHKGFAVSGYPPGALEEARAAHARVVAMAEKAGGAVPKPFDENEWRTNTKKRRVAKPYAIRQAATQCAELACKAGWTEVEVVELAPPPSI